MNLRKLVLIVLLAAAVLALAGADSASATELCKANESPCSAENMYGNGTQIRLKLKSGTDLKLVHPNFTTTCSGSEISGRTSSTGGPSETVGVSIEEITFEGCTCDAFLGCECAIKLAEKGSLEIHTAEGTANGNGSVTLKGFKWTEKCGTTSCTFGSATAITLGTLTGGSPALLPIKASIAWLAGDGSNFVCTQGVGFEIWRAEYEVTSPAPLFVI